MNQTTGQQLREAREALKISLPEAAHATRMRERYLRALEDDDLQSVPSSTQARGFLRAYAAFLKLDPELLLEGLGQNNATNRENSGTSDQPKPSTGASDTQPIDYQAADTIFVEIGKIIQHQRELLGLSLDDVVKYTHLRRHYLAALEAGKLDDLPSPVQARGMLGNYAAFLALDPEPLLLRFAEGLQARLAVRQEAAPPGENGSEETRRRRPLPAPLRRLLSPDILIGVTFVILLLAFVGWGSIRIFSMGASGEPTPSAPSIAEVLLATATPGITPTADVLTATPTTAQAVLLPDSGSATETVGIIIPTGSAPGVQVYVTILQRAWLRAVVDGEIEFEGRVLPGSAYPFVGESAVEILTSNGAAVQLFYNQQDLGVMGLIGQMVNRIFTTSGILTPTPTVTKTPSPTPRTTPTPITPVAPGGTPQP